MGAKQSQQESKEIVTPDVFHDELVDKYDIKEDNVTEVYRQWRNSQSVPFETPLYIKDFNEMETSRWDLTGQDAVIVNLIGNEGLNDLQIHEIEPEGETTVQHHLYDELVYVADGHGFTEVGKGEDQIRFEWEKDAMFYLPSAVPYSHVNNSDDEEARLVAATSLPMVITQVRNADLIFNPGYDAWKNHQDDDFFTADGTIYRGEYTKTEYYKGKHNDFYWEANFIPNITQFDKLQKRQYRGAGDRNCHFPMPHSSMHSHVSEFAPGRYKLAHRHGPGAQISPLKGEGYSLVWKEHWDEMVKMDWQPGSVFSPPTLWFHQHFNTSSDVTRYFVFHAPRLANVNETPELSGSGNPELNQIDYVDEDPVVRETFEQELAEKGIDSDMPDEVYTNPDYTFD